MKSILSLFSIVVLSSCSSFTEEESNLERFYHAARYKEANPKSEALIDTSGLDVREGLSFRTDRLPTPSESSIVVTEHNNPNSRHVLVYVSPRVSGSFLDSPDAKDTDRAPDIHEALQKHEYIDVHLLPRN
jgi:hypothetical protein